MATLTTVTRSPGSVARHQATWLPGSREDVSTVLVTTTALAMTTTALATKALLPLGLPRAGVAIMATDLKVDMLRRALPQVLLRGNSKPLLLAASRPTATGATDTDTLLAWLRRPLRACPPCSTAVLAVLLRLRLATSLPLRLLAINLLPLPLPRERNCEPCQSVSNQEKLSGLTLCFQ